ncbi:U-box domain-containing protein 19-like [Cucurbita pepo subsp. pepo]|uniref:U-box domain-containing protein 19-like n=1 Tax=Cucurbita pepo subsp. pepo TaxID=3664 RepID=UPI000C9D6AEF|nr:U-box domain-containing protein 19-like [Cucurbita pepo subsp. pepo]
MIRKSNDFNRRILSLPAIQPCECTSPATLLTSLINISRNICGYRSEFFGSNKRNAIKAIRQIEILLMFFEEIQGRKAEDLSDSVVLILLELHFIFQKLLFLLEDCALEGARLFMLMKSEFVANRFQVLIRSVALALEILPLDSIDLPIEVVEFVELATKQTRKMKFQIDREDEEILIEVRSILAVFDCRVTPDNTQIKRFLDYIGIKTWSLCNKEVKFLESEIEIEWSAHEKLEFSFLSKLIGLMNYCRCILFDVIDYEAVPLVHRYGAEIIDCFNHDDFRCPISLDFMIDPVTVGTGQTYDRSSIQKWLRAGNSTCPKTGERLKNRELVPNLALRRIIRRYCSKHSTPYPESSKQKRNITRTIVAGSSTAEKIVWVLAKYLARLLETGTPNEKNKAAYEIKLLSKSSIFYRSYLVEVGLIPNLLKLLRSSDGLMQKNAIAAVLNLSKHSKSKRVIAENRGLEAIINVLTMGYTTEARQLSAYTLFYMASIEEYRKLIGQTPEALMGLMNLLKEDSDRSKKNAMVAIYGLLTHPENHRKVLSIGAVPSLVNLLETSDRETLIADSMEILATLAEKPEGAAAIMRCGALSLTMEFMSSCSSSAGREYSVCLLLALCIHGGCEVVRIVAKSEAVISSLYIIIREGTARGRRKAGSLMRILHEHCEVVAASSDPIPVRLSNERSVQAW